MRLAGRYSGWVALMPTVCVVRLRSAAGALMLVLARDSPADKAALGSRPARACSARLVAASSWALADCQGAS